MLRTTISRLKKVCTIAYVPRFLRGYQPYSPGKVEIFSYAVVKRAPKSTKSSAGDDEPDPKAVTHKDDQDFLIVPDKEAKSPEKHAKETGPPENTKEEGFTPMVLSPGQLRDDHCEECQRIIDKAFGKEEIEPVLGEHFYNHAAVEETRRAITKAELAKLQYTADMLKEQIVPDQRVNFGLYKSREFAQDELSAEPEASLKDSVVKPTEKIMADGKPAKPQEQRDELGFLAKSLRVLPAEEGNSDLSERVRNAHPAKKKDLNLSEYMNIFKNASFDKNQRKQSVGKDSNKDDLEKIKIRNQNVYLSKQGNPGTIDREEVQTAACGAKSGQETKIGYMSRAHTMQTTPHKVEQEALNPVNLDGVHLKEYVVNATTAKEPEEQLTQKIEHIDETPLVEAHTPKVEGFSITPRVLGKARESIKNYCDKHIEDPGSSPGIDSSASYDEVAKRCLDTPTSQIDEILLKEMEKLGIPITGHRDSGIRLPVCENDLVQMDVLKKPRRPVEKKDIDLESHECERGAVDLCKPLEMEDNDDATLDYPILRINKESALPDHDEEAIMQLVELIKNEQLKCDAREEQFEEADTADTTNDAIHPNQVLIDPYDKTTIARDTGEYDPDEWHDPKRGCSYMYIPTFQNEREHDRHAALAQYNAPEDTAAEAETNPTPAMSPNHFAWFKEKTKGYMAQNLTYDDDGTTEIEPVAQPHKRLCEKNDNNETTGDTYSRYMDMCDPSGFWRHQYAEGNRDQRDQPKNIYEKQPAEMRPRLYGCHPGNNYYNKNSHLQQQSHRQSEFNTIIANTSQSGDLPERVARKPASPSSLFRKVSVASRSEAPTPAYYLSKGTTNIKDTLKISNRMKEPSNINAVEKVLNVKPNTTVPAKLAHKVKSIALPPPTYRIYRHMLKSHMNPRHPMRARPIRPKPADSLEAPYTLHSIREDVPLEHKRPHTTREARRSQERPEPLTHTSFSTPQSEEIEELRYENATPLTLGQGENFRYKTFENLSDELWDAADASPNEQLTQRNYEKVLQEEMSPSAPNIRENIEASTHAAKRSPAVLLFESEHFDPKHVLTCNETCPIALRASSMKPSDSSRLKAVFDRDFAKSNIRHYSPSSAPTADEKEPLPGFECLSDINRRAQLGDVPNLMHADSCLADPASAEVTAAALSDTIVEPIQAPTRRRRSPAPTDPTPLQSEEVEVPALPKLNEDVSLSELLRRVRLRNKLIEQAKNVNAVEASKIKCPPGPRCHPTGRRAPPNNPVILPPFALPMLKPRPRTCPPPKKKKPRKSKFSTCDLDLGTGLHLGSTNDCPDMVCEMNDVGAINLAPYGKMSVADLTDDVVERLHELGEMLGGIWQGSKLVLARDYDPWTPIPAWPSKKKSLSKLRKQSRCEPGCKSYPPTRTEHDPPCAPKPCVGYPRKHYSLLDCFAVSLGDHDIMYDLGEY